MKSDMENREWLNEYGSLKQVNPNNPFTVPEGYFNGLEDRLASLIKLEGLKNKMPLSGFTVPENYFEELDSNIQSRIAVEEILSVENTGFTVPEAYFEGLSGQIAGRIRIEEALKPEHNPLAVPDNYFDELSSKIQSRIAVEEALNPQQTGFTVPENYFDELSSKIQSRIFVEEALAGSAEALAVPDEYFTALNKAILNQTVNSKGKIVKLFSSASFKYATAACFALIVGTGIFIAEITTPAAVHNRSYLHKQLATVPIDEIESYLQLNVDDAQHALSTGGSATDKSALDDTLQNYTNSSQ